MIYTEYIRPGERFRIPERLRKEAPIFVVLAMTLEDYADLTEALKRGGAALVDKPKK